ncbi:MAG: aspartate/glutamate racemase family protein [Hyphomicrobiales bacterium]|nr:aspartate/glutamate racemase family protein [Hyphomicrobiales bacterium]
MTEPTLGILMLDNAFERYLGDIGNPATFDAPVIFERVPGASTKAVTTLADGTFLEPFAAAAERLVTRGAAAIATSCGFLALYQRELAERLPVPVATSALLQVRPVEQLLPRGRRVGVLTFDGASLGPAHLTAVGAPPDTPIEGLPPNGRFRRALLGDASVDGYAAREAEAVATARALIDRRSDIGALVLECTNLVPHAAAIQSAVRLPVYDVWTLLSWLRSGLSSRVWPRPAQSM